ALPISTRWRQSASGSQCLPIVSWAFRVTGLSPRRTMARANISGVNSGLSDRSISLSVVAFNRFQSERDFLEVIFFFIPCSFSGRDDANGVVRLRMNNKQYKATFFAV